MKRKCLLSCFVLLLLLPPDKVSADLPLINIIRDLRTIQFGNSFPRHGHMLLHYITNSLDIDQNHRIRPRFLPWRGDLGFHRYNNYENIFPSINNPNAGAYYAVGNLNPNTYIGASQLPPYVTDNYYRYNTYNDRDRNRDRIVIRMRLNAQVVEGMYITQHLPNSNLYDPDQSFSVSVTLLREIQLMSENRVNSLSTFLYESGYVVNSRAFSARCILPPNQWGFTEATAESAEAELKTKWSADKHKECFEIQLQVRTTSNGYARLKWDNIPVNLLGVGTKLQLYSDKLFREITIDQDSYGFYDSNQYLNPRLQVRLLTSTNSFIMSSPEMNDAYRKLPTDLDGFKASLQLYVKDGYACAHLYIDKTFENWKDTFYYSWVGFYVSNESGNKQYKRYQWAIYFTKLDSNDHYDIYKYESWMSIAPGAQARFFLTKAYDSLAVTAPWES